MKVLIIDDDNFIRTVYKSAFEQENIKVDAVETGEAGLESAKAQKPDLILLDMILPGMSGFVILKELKSDGTLKDVPVIVFSSLSQQSDIDEALKLGALKHMPKDQFSVAQIVAEVKKTLKV